MRKPISTTCRSMTGQRERSRRVDKRAARAERDNVIELTHPAAQHWAGLAPREISPEDWRRFRGYIAEIFGAYGMDLDTPGTRETPERFLRALFDATSGYD